MKRFILICILIIVGLSISIAILSSTIMDFYKQYPHTNRAVLDDEKYVIYFYGQDDLYSQYLLEDMTKFAQVSSENNIGFYLMDLDKKEGEVVAMDTNLNDAQSGTDYPVTPEQANELGLEQLIIAGAPELIYVEDGIVKNMGVGVQSSEMGNSYVSIQDTLDQIAKANNLNFESTYVYSQ